MDRRQPPPGLAALDGREVYLERVEIGAYLETRAIDAATGVEAVVMTPAAAASADADRLALRKLVFLLEKRNGGTFAAPPSVSRRPPGGGWTA